MGIDIIYREEAIKAMEQRYKDILRTFKRKVKVGEKAIALDMIGCVRNLPSADRPQGEWIKRGYWSEGIGMGESYGFYYECSNCGKQAQGDYYECGMNYCPNCGADMKEREGE